MQLEAWRSITPILSDIEADRRQHLLRFIHCLPHAEDDLIA